MNLAPGSRLGPYEIVDKLGEGGMGAVFLAQDTRLPRRVAIKMLPAGVASDARLRLRLEKEAKAISSLAHPHICALHDIGREGDADYLVLEYCEGPTLAEKISPGGLPLRQVFQFGIEIAEALGSAHRAGIVHRDLKPSNVALTAAGVKLLDFGLAGREPHPHPEGATATTTLEATGGIMGTPGYIAPEVLAGAEADARSDVFALGAVLYEMITGTPPFAGTSRASMIAAVLERDPRPLSALRADVPPELEQLVATCLAKSPEERWESARDVAQELRWIRDRTPAQSGRSIKPGTLAAVAAVAVLAILAAAAWVRWSAVRNRTAVDHLSISVEPLILSRGWATPDLAISPDGRRIVFTAVSLESVQLHVRRLDAPETTPLAGTSGAMTPFFSPDGQWIGFFAGRALKRVHVSGARVETLAADATATPRGATWAPDGTIYFPRNYALGIWKLRPGDSAPVPVTVPDRSREENSHRWPQILPDGKHLLMTVRTGRLTTFDDASIDVLDLATGTRRTVVRGGSAARYVRTGHLVWARRGALYAARFDVRKMKLLSEPVVVANGVLNHPSSGAAHWAVAENAGTLLFQGGGVPKQASRLEVVSRSGARREFATLPSVVDTFSVAPDQTRLALQLQGANDDVWLYQVGSGALTRLTFEAGDEFWPTWSPDGTRVVFGSPRGICWQASDGSGPAVALVEGRVMHGSSVSPDGRAIAFVRHTGATASDVVLVDTAEPHAVLGIAETPFIEQSPQFSPDGKWIAYSSNESGTFEIYIRAAAGGRGKLQVSVGGGTMARWSKDGREIFYSNGPRFFAVPVTLAPIATAGRPVPLFSIPVHGHWDLFGDGFLVHTGEGPLVNVDTLHVTLGWLDEVERIAR